MAHIVAISSTRLELTQSASWAMNLRSITLSSCTLLHTICKSNRSWSAQRDDSYPCQCKYIKRYNGNGCCVDTRNKKAPPAREDKYFKPCHVHREHAKHSYEECRVNPCNQVGSKPRANNNNKCTRPHKSHYHHHARYASSDNESRGSAHTPVPSNGKEASVSGSSKTVDDNLHLSFEGRVPQKQILTDTASWFRVSKPAKSTKKVSDDRLSWDEVFEVAYLSNLEIASDADLGNRIQVENPFVFGNWCPTLVEPRKSTTSTNCLENALYKLGLQHSKQLSSLVKTDFYITNISPDSTSNAPKDLSTSNKYHIYTDDVYAISISEDDSSDRQQD